MQEQIVNQCVDNIAHLSALSGISYCVISTEKRELLYPDKTQGFCKGCTCSRCIALNTHLYGCNEAYRWNGKYIYYCPLGLVFVASSISDESGNLVGGIIMGPLLMGDYDDVLMEMDDFMRTKAVELPALSTSKVTNLSVVLSAVTGQASGMPHSRVGKFVYEQEKLLNSIYAAQEKMMQEGGYYHYPIEIEKNCIR